MWTFTHSPVILTALKCCSLFPRRGAVIKIWVAKFGFNFLIYSIVYCSWYLTNEVIPFITFRPGFVLDQICLYYFLIILQRPNLREGGVTCSWIKSKETRVRDSSVLYNYSVLRKVKLNCSGRACAPRVFVGGRRSQIRFGIGLVTLITVAYPEE